MHNLIPPTRIVPIPVITNDVLIFKDIQYGDIDYMEEKRDFTIDPINFADLPEYVDQLREEGTRFVIILVSKSISIIIHNTYIVRVNKLIICYDFAQN